MNTCTSKDGTRLAYDVHGSGPPLVYITGAICHRAFKPVASDAKAFGAAFAVYNYDRRGRGDSSDTPPYAIEREVEDVEAVIDAAGGTAHLYGHSSGAALALEAALRLGDKVDRVVLYDLPYVHDAAEKASYANLEGRVRGLLQEGKNGQAIRLFLNGIGMPTVFAQFLRFMPGWHTIAALAPTLTYDIALTRDPPPLDRASRIAVPVHIVAGEKSPDGVQQVARQLAEAIPHATFELLPGQDHMASAKTLLPVLTRALAQR